MKIRNGFVSNSSSSSFVLDGRKLTVRDVALMMIPLREWNFDGDDDHALCQRIKYLSCNPDTPMTFPSCNEDTFIIKRGEYIFVDTCNNHPFWEVLDGHRREIDLQTLRELCDNDEVEEDGQMFYPMLEDMFVFYTISEMEKMGQSSRERIIKVCQNVLGAEYESMTNEQQGNVTVLLERAALKLFIDNSNMKCKAVREIREALQELRTTGEIK